MASIKFYLFLVLFIPVGKHLPKVRVVEIRNLLQSCLRFCFYDIVMYADLVTTINTCSRHLVL